MPVYKLLQTPDWPALMIDGILMHRIKGTSPKKDAEDKIALLKIRGGNVLDICTGLGYTAIIASHYADYVVTIEKDKEVIRIARKNPASEELFNSKKISLIEGDATKVIKKFQNEFFDYIIHDPPTFARAGELYSGSFYKELFRVLRYKGVLFHYTGLPCERYRKKSLRKGIIERLRAAGFRIKNFRENLGLLCEKL
ncbi:MAG: RsmD family RNA methyltransferase [Candidatus Diapherotrites archaeon]|nr:RsmD family RNA methyltransferase [Candidatus Diapherotrites archaeon]